MNDFDVELATDGEAGKEAFSKGKFDLCIFDVMAEAVSGIASAMTRLRGKIGGWDAKHHPDAYYETREAFG